VVEGDFEYRRILEKVVKENMFSHLHALLAYLVVHLVVLKRNLVDN